jgi:chromosome segregation ATPase
MNEVTALTEKVQQLSAKNSKAFASLKTVNEEKAKLQEQVTKLQERLKNVIQENKNKEVRDYIGYLVELHGVDLPDKSRALLEKCTSKDEVNGLWEDVLDGFRAQVRHPGKVETLTVASQAIDENQANVDRAVGSIFEGVHGKTVISEKKV